jgi:hypothetical protein
VAKAFARAIGLSLGPLFGGKNVEYRQVLAGSLILNLITQASDFLLNRCDLSLVRARL